MSEPWAAYPPPSTAHRDPGTVDYHLLLTAGRPAIWRPLLGIPLVLLLAFGAAPVLVQVPFGLYFLASGRDLEAAFTTLLDLENPTPASLAYLNVVLAASIPITFLAVRVLHGLRPGWLTSVRPRLRWGFFVVCLGLAFVALLATVVVSAVLPSGEAATAGEVSDTLNSWTDQTRDFVLVVLLLTPLQAAGEEYLFRGYLTQAFGRIFARAGLAVSRAVAVVVPALLFALAHGLGQGLPIFLDRLAFGLVAGVLVLVTGGLEAGIAMHVLNNWLAFGFALAFGDLGSSLNPTGGSWWLIPATLTQSLVFLGLVYAVARASGLPRGARPEVLEASRRLG